MTSSDDLRVCRKTPLSLETLEVFLAISSEKSNRPSEKLFLESTYVPSHEQSTLTVNSSEAMTLRWWLRMPWDYTMMALGLLYWGIFGGLLTLIGGPLHLILPQQMGRKLGRALLHQLFRKFVIYLRLSDLVRADLTALDQLGSIKHSFIAAPNHTSLWDVVFIIARLPSAVCVIKKQIMINPLLGGGARLANYIANDGTTRMIRAATKSLAEGGQLLLFPEGTRTRADARWINPLKGGCAIIATHSQVPVYPIFIRSDTRFLQKGWPLWRRPVFPIHMHFDLGEPLTPLPGESAQAFTARLTAAYHQELSKPHSLRRQVTMDEGNASH
jgi:1-acyl-sn-glycerol-3-phosphate acyltransferase